MEGLWEMGVMWTVWEGVRWVNFGEGEVGSFSSSFLGDDGDGGELLGLVE